MAPSFTMFDISITNDTKQKGKSATINQSIQNTKTTIVIISKGGSLSECVVEPAGETTLEELTILLSKKCGYRNHNGFSCYHTYRYKNKRNLAFDVSTEEVIPKYIYVDVWAKTEGRAGSENKYEMPPPIDELIFYGNIALVARMDNETAIHLTTELWNIIYEKLFGGFEDLAASALADENESDELDSVPSHKKTSSGYLKDGFVVDDDSEDKTPRGRVKGRGRGGKKNKSESTESEFITETETESGTPPSDSPLTSDADADADIDPPPVVECNHKVSKPKSGAKLNLNPKPTVTVTAAKPKRNVKSKKSSDEPVIAAESESELSEEEYV
jgi:hypothetical protein